ncbi:MAG: hypothetical protein U9N54_10480, partial [candidate division Zixibacteria bacterium]|nr:hypothetical protein [candidate division Zixibacteria bacterium]
MDELFVLLRNDSLSFYRSALLSVLSPFFFKNHHHRFTANLSGLQNRQNQSCANKPKKPRTRCSYKLHIVSDDSRSPVHHKQVQYMAGHRYVSSTEAYFV